MAWGWYPGRKGHGCSSHGTVVGVTRKQHVISELNYIFENAITLGSVLNMGTYSIVYTGCVNGSAKKGCLLVT